MSEVRKEDARCRPAPAPSPQPPPPRSTKEVEERPWKRGSAWANRNCTDEPGLPCQHFVLFWFHKCDLYLLWLWGWGRQRQETWFTFLKQANPSMRDQLHEWITLQNLWRPVGTAVSVRPPSWPAIVCCSVWIPRNPATQNFHPAKPVCGTLQCQSDWQRAIAGWACAPKGSAMECWKYVVSGKFVKTGSTCRCSVG